MQLIVRLIISTIAVLVTDLLLSGVHAADFLTGLLVAVVLGLLNTIVKPLLVILTLPVTILTLGIFLLVINAGLVMLAAKLIDGFVGKVAIGYNYDLLDSKRVAIFQHTRNRLLQQ